MPDMGTTLNVRWRGKIRDGLFPVHFRFFTHPTAGVLTIGSNGITNSVNLRGNLNSWKDVPVPSESRSVPLADVLSVWLALLSFCRPFLNGFSISWKRIFICLVRISLRVNRF